MRERGVAGGGSTQNHRVQVFWVQPFLVQSLGKAGAFSTGFLRFSNPFSLGQIVTDPPCNFKEAGFSKRGCGGSWAHGGYVTRAPILMFWEIQNVKEEGYNMNKEKDERPAKHAEQRHQNPCLT